MADFPQYPAHQPEAPVRKRRTGLIVTVVVAGMVLVVGGLFVLRGVMHNADAAPPPAGITTLPAHCDFLPDSVAAQLVPDSGNGQDKGAQDTGWGLIRHCIWGHWDETAGAGRSIDITVTAMLNRTKDEPEPNPGAADDEVRSMESKDQQTVAGADEAYLAAPQIFGVDHVTQELMARHQNVVVDVTYDPGGQPTPAERQRVLTAAAEQVLATIDER